MKEMRACGECGFLVDPVTSPEGCPECLISGLALEQPHPLATGFVSGPTSMVWLVTDALGGHVGVGATEAAAQQVAVDDFALLPRREVRTWAELAACGLYIIDEVALVRERR